MLQDRVPYNPHWQAYLLFHYVSSLPIFSPAGNGLERYFRMPAYSRADVGLSYVFFDKNMPLKRNATGILQSCSVTLEIMNLFDLKNTSSFLWIPTIMNGALQMVAVPNYLTPRMLNVKVGVGF
jgi:hypothetical protein